MTTDSIYKGVRMNRTTHYRCDDCGLIFRDGDGGTYKDNMGVSDPYSVWVTFQCCPECRCEDLEPINVCDDCGEQEPEPGHDQCRECLTILAVEAGERANDDKRERFA